MWPLGVVACLLLRPICHTCDFIARFFCRATLSCDKVAVCNCACRTLQLCRINKHWPSWLVIFCLCDKIAVCDMHSVMLQPRRAIKLRDKIAWRNRRCDIGLSLKPLTSIYSSVFTPPSSHVHGADSMTCNIARWTMVQQLLQQLHCCYNRRSPFPYNINEQRDKSFNWYIRQ